MINLKAKIVVMCLCVGSLSAAVNKDYNSQYTAGRKLGRGVANLLGGVFEIPKTAMEENKRNGWLAAYTTGVITGIGRFIERELVGVVEIVTFPFGDREPYIKPEYVLGTTYDEGYEFDIKPNDHSDHFLHQK